MKSLPKLRFTPIRHRWHTPDLVIVITSFQLFGPNILELCGNKYFDFLRTRSMVFHLNESCALYQTSIFFIANIVFYTFLTPLKEGVFRTMTDISFSTPPPFFSQRESSLVIREIYIHNKCLLEETYNVHWTFTVYSDVIFTIFNIFISKSVFFLFRPYLYVRSSFCFRLITYVLLM